MHYLTFIGVALLPFIDETRLLNAMESVYPQLTTEEVKRNTCGSEVLCFSNSHKLYNILYPLYLNQNPDKVRTLLKFFETN